MKTLAFITAISLQLAATSAWAIFAPDWERPVASAKTVEVIMAEGEMASIDLSEVTMRQKMGSRDATSLELIIDGQAVVFQVSLAVLNDCGAYMLMALAKPMQANGDYLELSIDDYTTSNCTNKFSHLWEGELNMYNAQGGWLGSLMFGANPDPVYTIQGEKPPVVDR